MAELIYFLLALSAISCAVVLGIYIGRKWTIQDAVDELLRRVDFPVVFEGDIKVERIIDEISLHYKNKIKKNYPSDVIIVTGLLMLKWAVEMEKEGLIIAAVPPDDESWKS